MIIIQLVKYLMMLVMLGRHQ